MRRRLLTALALAATGLILALPAQASRAPTRAERAAVLAAAKHFLCCQASGRKGERVTRIVVSTASSRWARFDARLGDTRDTGVVQRTRKGWRVRGFGDPETKPWCDASTAAPPDAVKRDLWGDDDCSGGFEP
jgi:hypothetical protein